LGRVEIKRLNVSAMVREGADAKILSISVGHVPSTSLPGETGNFAIAAHRDTLFRALKDIKKRDLVTFEAPTATYTYEVAATKIVKPTNIAVLRSNGGGVIPDSDNTPGDTDKLLTMITCYPFYYVGSAPKRFIVEAKLVSITPTSPSGGTATAKVEAPGAETPAVANAAPDTSSSEATLAPPGQHKKKRHFSRKVTRAL
jgi:sortase A